MTDTTAALSHADKDFDAALERLNTLLRIPSISTDPAFAKDVRKAGQWVNEYLKTLGFDVKLCETPGYPVVLATYTSKSTAKKPRLLFYAHYDVQPVDPLNLWDSDPFDPQIKTLADGTKQIVARGSSDDKGQLMTIVEGLAAILKTSGDLPCDVVLLFEGEEESGSPSLEPFMKENAAALKADLALVCDTSMWDKDTPSITTSLRGLVGEEITLTCSSRDLHSGEYGGPAQNPIRVLAKILSALHDDNGHVTIPDFYDGVPELPHSLRAQWASMPFDEKKFLAEVGLTKVAGEKGFSALELVWARPTCEFNGISGGYTGEGFKTVLPSIAHVKVSCRLVGQQNPEKIRKNLRAFFEQRLPADCKIEFHAHGGSPGFQVPIEGEAVTKASAALKAEWGRDTILQGGGGSIPVVEAFKRILGLDTLMIGYALKDDRIHSPNEKYNVESYRKGIRSWVRVVDELTK